MKSETQPVKFGSAAFWWQYITNPHPFICRINQFRVRLRPRTFDAYVLMEIFDKKIYWTNLKKKPGLVIIDLGANIGLFSLWAFGQYNIKELFAVEPDEANFQLLSSNLKLNTLEKKVNCLKLAIGKKTGQARFRTMAFNKGMNRLSSAGEEGNLVKVLTFERLLAEIDSKQIDILKVDVEGAEKYIFTPENSHLFREKIKLVLGEWHGGSGLNSKNLKKYFVSAGFSFKIIEENPLMGAGIFRAIKRQS